MSKFIGFACVLVLASPGFARAQIGTTTTTTTTTTPDPATTLRASQILGSSVHLQGTNNFGKVEDIVFAEDGGPAYLVVSNGGQSALMPLNAATFDMGQRAITYDVTPQAVRPLFFGQNAYPNVGDQQFVSRTNQVFPGAGGKMKIKTKPNGVIKEKIKNP